MKKEQIESYAIDIYNSHKSKFINLKETWEDLESRYSNKLREGSIASKTKIKVALGKAYSVIENAIPRLLSQQPRYKYMARGSEDVEATQAYEDFAQYQWDEANCQNKVKELAKWGLITGLVGWKIGWQEKKTIKKKRSKSILGVELTNPMAIKTIGKLIKTKTKDVEETTSNYTFDVIKPWDLIWNPEATGMDDIRVFGHKVRKTIAQFENDGFEMEELKTLIRQQKDEWRQRMEEKDEISEEGKLREVEFEEVEIAEMYLKVMDKGTEKNYIVHLAYLENNPIVLGFRENPLDQQFIPMGAWRPIRRPGKFYGFGLIESSRGIIDAEEDYLNMILEAEWLNVARPMIYDPFKLRNPQDLKFEPGALVAVKGDSREVLNTIETPKPDINGGMALMEVLNRAQQNTTGITDFQTGSQQIRGAKTLGEIQIKTEESNARLKMLLDSFEKEVLEPVGRMALWMNQQFLADQPEIVYRVVGRKGEYEEKPIDFKSLDGIKDVSVVSGSSALVMQQSEIQKWSLLLDKATQELQLPPQMAVPIDRQEIWKRMLEQGLMIKEVEVFLPSLKEQEEKEVGGMQEQMEDAKSENENPFTARVLPTDNHEVHMKLHQGASNANGTAQREYTPEETQRITQHIDEHAQAAGGQTPNYEQNVLPSPPGVPGQSPMGAGMPPQASGM